MEFQNIYELFENGIRNNRDREILGKSLFYYCCGKDPTPIIAFGDVYPIYIYSDIVDYGTGDFNEETNVLYERLRKAGFKLNLKRELKKTKHLGKTKNAILTMWSSPHQKSFFLLYVQNDASETFRMLYSDGDNYIQPKCVCNYKHNLSYDSLLVLEKRTEYILGHCYSNKYQCIAEYDYYGDYGENIKVQLFHRIFYYLY